MREKEFLCTWPMDHYHWKWIRKFHISWITMISDRLMHWPITAQTVQVGRLKSAIAWFFCFASLLLPLFCQYVFTFRRSCIRFCLSQALAGKNRKSIRQKLEDLREGQHKCITLSVCAFWDGCGCVLYRRWRWNVFLTCIRWQNGLSWIRLFVSGGLLYRWLFSFTVGGGGEGGEGSGWLLLFSSYDSHVYK